MINDLCRSCVSMGKFNNSDQVSAVVETQNHALGRLKIHQSLLMHILEVRAFSIEEGFV